MRHLVGWTLVISYATGLIGCEGGVIGASSKRDETPSDLFGAGGWNAGGAGTGGSPAPGNGGVVGVGSAPQGGSTGGSPPAHVVGTCDSLLGVDEWEEVTPPIGNSENGVLTVLVDPVNAGTVYVGTDKQGVWKTTDCGSTWVKTNTGSGGAALDTGLLWSMGINPVHPDFIYAGSLYSSDNSLLRSTDSGVTWTSLFPAGSEIATHVEYNFLQELSIDPVDPNHIVVTFHADCRAPYAKMCMAESLDRGDTWRMFNGPADAWVENSRPLALNLTSFLYVTGQDGVWHTGDSGRTWDKTSMPGGGHQLYIRNDGEYFLGSYAGVWQSSNGKDWSKIEGSPAIDGLTGDGERIFGAMSNDGGRQPFYSAPVDAGGPWTKLASPPIGGSPRLEYEKDHHVLYAATKADGLWRMVTQ